MDKVSVYIPTRNRRESLMAAVDSVRRQTYKSIEIVIVNDGSNDGTSEYLSELSSTCENVKTITHSQARGGGAARNTAIRAATGELITGLDDDDEFSDNRIELFVHEWAALKKQGEKVSLLFSDIRVMNDGHAVGDVLRSPVVFFDNMFAGNAIGNQVFGERSTFIEAGLFNEDLPAWQDLEFFMRILKKFGPARRVPGATYYWDDSARPDRISLKNEEKLRQAFEMVSRLHAGGVGRRTQQLALVLFGRYYKVRPTYTDWIRFIRGGLWVRGLLRLLYLAIIRSPTAPSPKWTALLR